MSNTYTSNTGEIFDGKIEGTVPQYIKKEGGEFLEVISMTGTFVGIDDLKYAPEIPSTVTELENTFAYCGGLEQAPRINSNVTNMNYTFRCCYNLTGEIVINANPSTYELCFQLVATVEGRHLILTGSSTKLQELLETKSSDESNITIGQ